MQISLQIKNQNGWDFVQYFGPINEEAEVHLSGLLTKLGANVVFNFKNVESVNSCGVRAWINFMRDLEKGRRVIFDECTPEIVMQINMIPSFKSTAQIQSVYGSYKCEACGHQKMNLFEANKNFPSAATSDFPEIACEKCGSKMEMDEMEDEFFAFTAA